MAPRCCWRRGRVGRGPFAECVPAFQGFRPGPRARQLKGSTCGARRLPHARTVRTCGALWMVLWTVCVPNVGRSDFHQQESHGTHVDSRWRAGAGLRRLAPVSESEEAQKPLRSFPDVSGAGTRVHWQELAPKGGRRGKDGTAERFRSGRGKAGASRAERGNSIPFVAGTAALLGVAGQGRRDGVDGSAHLAGIGPTVGAARVPQGAGRSGGDSGAGPEAQEPAAGGSAARNGTGKAAQAPLSRGSRKARVRSGSPACGQGSDVSGTGFRRAARGRRDPRRWNAVGSGGPGPGRTCEAGPPEECPGFGCHEAAGGLAQAGCRWCRMRGVHARFDGPREASGSPLSRPDNGTIARSPLAPLSFQAPTFCAVFGERVLGSGPLVPTVPFGNRRHSIGNVGA